jgi:hypothetical protein
VTPPATSLVDSTGTLTNVSCSAYFSYLRNQRIRTSRPTERLSLRSNYLQRLDIVASFSYSSAHASTPLDESFNGLITRAATRAFAGTGTADAREISDALDLEATLHVTKHLRLIEKFYFWAYRIPENARFAEVDSVCTGACTLLTPLSATAPATTDTLTQSSFNQTIKRNQTEVAWDISKKTGVRIGYRYGDRVFDHFIDFLPGNEDHLVVHEHTGHPWAVGTTQPRAAIELRSGARQLRQRSGPHRTAEGITVPVPDGLYTPAVGGLGGIHQHSARFQRRLIHKLHGATELWIHRFAHAARARRARLGV